MEELLPKLVISKEIFQLKHIGKEIIKS